jgi:hypothetical protein
MMANAKAHAPRSAGAGDGHGVGVVAWGGHENWAADRGCHAATCSWKEIPRKRGCIHGRSSPNPPPAQVTKPAPRRIGGTQAHKLLLMGIGDPHSKSCHIHRKLISTRHHVITAGLVKSPGKTHSQGQPRLTSDMPSLFHSPRTPKCMHPDQRGRALDAGLGLWRGVGMKTGRLIGVVMPRLVRGRKSHGSTAAFTGDPLQIQLQRKSQSQPHEESAEPKHTSCCSGDSTLTTGNPVIFTGDSAQCGIP